MAETEGLSKAVTKWSYQNEELLQNLLDAILGKVTQYLDMSAKI
jgi:hypothetical protein